MAKKPESELFDEKTARLHYLNKSGDKCVRIDAKGRRERLPVSFDGVNVKMVSVAYWEQCGNFSYPVVRQGKKLVTVYPDSEVEVTKYEPYEIKYPNK